MTVSAATTSQADILAQILAELTGNPASALQLTRAQLLAGILTEVGGVSVSALQVGESELERRAIAAFDSERGISFPAATTTKADIWAGILNALVDGGGGGTAILTESGLDLLAETGDALYAET